MGLPAWWGHSHALAWSAPRAVRTEPSSATEVIQASVSPSDGLIFSGAVLAMPLGLSCICGYKWVAHGLNQSAWWEPGWRRRLLWYDVLRQNDKTLLPTSLPTMSLIMLIVLIRCLRKHLQPHSPDSKLMIFSSIIYSLFDMLCGWMTCKHGREMYYCFVVGGKHCLMWWVSLARIGPTSYSWETLNNTHYCQNSAVRPRNLPTAEQQQLMPVLCWKTLHLIL